MDKKEGEGMKYIVVLGDGMADEEIEALGNKTPLAYASTPEMDRLSKMSEIGMVHTIPDGMKPGWRCLAIIRKFIIRGVPLWRHSASGCR